MLAAFLNKTHTVQYYTIIFVGQKCSGYPIKPILKGGKLVEKKVQHDDGAGMYARKDAKNQSDPPKRLHIQQPIINSRSSSTPVVHREPPHQSTRRGAYKRANSGRARL